MTMQQQRRELSSAAVAIDTSSSSLHEELMVTKTSTITKRKRLEELRNRLQNEEVAPKLKSFSLKEEEEESTNIYDILQRLPPMDSTIPILNNTIEEDVLTDRFHRKHSYLRISLSERCNLRCQYCMPPEGVPLQHTSKLLQRDEIMELASIFGQYGVDKIRLTGGEPLLRKDLVDIVRDLKSIPSIRQIGMTTNGITLKRHLDALADAGLTHINISLDTTSEDKFLHLTRRPGLKKVLEAIELASSNEALKVKINCVVMRNTNEDEIVSFCELTRQLPVDVRFIEWMPFFDNGWSKDNGLVPYQEMLDIAAKELQLQRIQDGPNDTTKWWQLDESAKGRIGFITSMSNHFCGTCNRLRLTADGQIKVCLFGTTELSLRDALRDPNVSQMDLIRLIQYAVQRKHHSLGGHPTPQNIADANNNRPMTLIGG
eukprot:CAMPEP_0194169624 /NCGR_PEP_ID=MMETSP0154-20130528/4287_1 /TAXON_ID=1049557 /ORGANISM="Thalassiothrix antarctica, Strain L6-D1" /LENGTH=429 /DNA_ID=CAMNT_0038881103 /DNA_START=91 /DNA_END=1380 /DNA_ORIENTATION=-